VELNYFVQEVELPQVLVVVLQVAEVEQLPMKLLNLLHYLPQMKLLNLLHYLPQNLQLVLLPHLQLDLLLGLRFVERFVELPH
jgi:hypothetical protein